MACKACVSTKYDAIIKQHFAMCRKYYEYGTKNFHATSDEIEKAIDKPAYIKNILEIMKEKCEECNQNKSIAEEILKPRIQEALNNFEKWNNITGFVDIHTSYYYELESIIEDSVKIGAGLELKSEE